MEGRKFAALLLIVGGVLAVGYGAVHFVRELQGGLESVTAAKHSTYIQLLIGACALGTGGALLAVMGKK